MSRYTIHNRPTFAYARTHSTTQAHATVQHNEEYKTPERVADTTPRQRNRAVRILPAASLYLNPPPLSSKNWGLVDPHLNNYHSDPMGISSTFWLPDITDWWSQQDEKHSKFANLSNVARDLFSIIPHGFELEASFSLGWDDIGWRQFRTTGDMLRERAVASQFA